jgi:inosine-uridine nucleoside N-ribohydrolase
MPRRVIIDTDPGIDDALALLLALQSPELDVAAITTVSGNVPVKTATLNVFRIFSLLTTRNRPPVAEGAEKPRIKDPVFGTHIHGEDGLGGLDRFQNKDGTSRYPIPRVEKSARRAADEIVYQLSKTTEPISLIPLGPLTNIAEALETDKTGMAAIKEIVLMGGAVEVPGNVTSVAEFNIYYDPHAADMVFNSGIPITVVGLDVTRKVQLLKENMTSIPKPNHTAISQFVCDSTAALFSFLEARTGEAGMSLHDPLAVGVAIDPSLVTKKAMSVAVETEGKWTQGMTVVDGRNMKPEWKESPNAQICVDVDKERFLSFFLDRLFPIY